MLKAEGRSVKTHPVIKQLAHLRTMLDKMKPVEKKLKYQIDKLVKMTSSDASADPLSFKPSLEGFGGDDETTAKKKKKSKKSKKSDEGEEDEDEEIYRAPHRGEVDDEDGGNKKDRLHIPKSVMKHLQSEIFRDKPEEFENTGVLRKNKFTEQVEAFEEDNFLRLQETKKMKKKRKRHETNDGFETFDDFGDYGFIDTLLEDDKKRQQNAIMEKRQKRVNFGNDDNMPSDDGDMFGAEEDNFYQKYQEQAKSKKSVKKQMYPKKEMKYKRKNPDHIGEDDRRGAGGKIMHNRGLTRQRPRDQKNPRVRHRKKFDKALVKRRSVVQEFKGKNPAYSGEQTGISYNIKSRKL